MKTKITPIIATFKRPILLERCLYYLNKNFKNLSKNKYILYRFDKLYHNEYKKIFKNRNLIIKKRQEKKKFAIKDFLKNNNFFSFYHYVKWYQVLTKFNSFKKDLETTLKSIKTDFVMIIPDDLIIYKKTEVPKKALEIMFKKPADYYYKFTSDYEDIKKSIIKENIYIRKFLHKKSSSFFLWKNNFKSKNIYLNYNFHFEAIYHRKTLLKFLKNFFYNNPTTMESIGYKMAKKIKYYNFGISPITRTATTYQINTIQNLVKQKHRINIDPQKLNNYFKEGYILNINKKLFEKRNIVQNKIQLKKNKKLIFI